VRNDFQENAGIYTVTMAEIYASQGHFNRAAQIYRHMLEAKPHDEALIKALADTEKKLLEQKRIRRDDLVVLFGEWIQLAERYRYMVSMQRLKQLLGGDD
jgi:hypothetical protein